MRLQILFAALLMVSVSVRSGAFAAEVKDYYEITDLETGARVQVPFVNNQVTCTERVLGKNDAKSVFYALRETNREFTLRTISYDGNVLEEKPLADFRC
jgi:RNA polymerase-interacting CarD/CdnL/TRCF family regulator